MTRSFPTRRQVNPKPRRTFRPQAEGLEGRQLLSAGDLDLSFGSGGFVLAGPTSAAAVQIQPDGKILAAGSTGSTNVDFRLVRRLANGAPDLAFGSGGGVTTDFFGRQDTARAMAVLADGRIVVVGIAGNVDVVPRTGKTNYYYSHDDFGLACYFSADTTITTGPYAGSYKAGSLDARFGAGGKVTTNISTYISTTDSNNKGDSAWAVAVQDDGKIVVGGRSFTGPGIAEAVLARYFASDTTANGITYKAGALDPSFGQGGILHIPTPADFKLNGVWRLAIQRGDTADPGDDKIVTLESAAVARYNLDGSADATFGAGGRQITTMAGNKVQARDIAFQPDGSIVVGGSYDYQDGTPTDLMLLRYTAAGAVDPTFGNAGVVLFDAGASFGTSDYAYAVAVQPDGKILLAGSSATSSLASSVSAIVVRFQSNGAVDSSFGTNGVARNMFTNSENDFNGLAVQTDGKVVAVGGARTQVTSKSSNYDILIARYQGDPVAPLSAVGAAIGGVPSIGPSAATGSRSRVSVADRYHPLSAETHEPGRWQASGQAELDLMPLPLEPVTTALPTARLAVGLSKRLRPALWFPSDVQLD